MSFFNKGPRTAAQKAQWAKTGFMLRAIALGYLIFFIVIPMINPEPEDVEGINPTLRYIIVAFFIVACTVLSVLSIRDYLRMKKNGLFTPGGYEDDEGIDTGVSDTEESAVEENDEDDDYEDDDDYDEDDDYEDYDDEEYIDEEENENDGD